jgi:hypothetical protein
LQQPDVHTPIGQNERKLPECDIIDIKFIEQITPQEFWQFNKKKNLSMLALPNPGRGKIAEQRLA